jgi:outer membrane protein assembly factor BamB
MKKIITIGIILLINSMAIAAAASSNWATFQHDNKRTGYTSGTGNIISPSLNTMYSANAGLSHPVVYNGIIFVGSDDGHVYALDGDNNVKWDVSIRDSADYLAVANGVLYVGSDDGAVYAFETTSGDQKWSSMQLVSSVKSLAVADGVIYAGTNGAVYAIDATSWYQIWERPTTTSANCLAIANIDSDPQKEIVIGGSNSVYAFDVNNNVEWEYTNVEDVSSIVIVDDVIYVGSENSDIFGLDGSDGDEIWGKILGDSVDCLAVADGVLYAGSSNGAVYAYETNTHSGILSKSTTSVHSLVIADTNSDGKNDIVISSPNKISVLDSNNGEKQWEININQGTPQLALADIDNDQKIEIVATAGSVLYNIDKGEGNNPPAKPTCSYNRNSDELVVRAIDPDGDQVKYGVDWDNDLNIDHWTSLASSGTEQRINCDGRQGTVSVIAEDEHGAQSDRVSVKPKSRQFINRPFLNFLQQYPRLLEILRALLLKF